MDSIIAKLLTFWSKAKNVLQILWAAPVTIPCMLVYVLPCWALGWYRLHSKVSGAWVFVLTEKVPNWLAKLWIPWAGHCVGTCVVLKRDPLSSFPAATTLVHELAHVKQVKTWGVLQPLLYVLSSLACFMAGENHYEMNAFEIAARRAASQKICK